jgi:hypothetical protein
MIYPLILLDFEASSLSDSSFPIEVGVAVAPTAQGPIHVWSSLIKPDRNWTASDDWDPAAEAVHHIPWADLVQGQSPRDVALALNSIIGPVGHAYCDGGYYDGMWMERLFKAAKIAPAFALWDMARLFLLDRGLYRRVCALLAENVAPHRAGDDAARLCGALLAATSGAWLNVVQSVSFEDIAELMANNVAPRP